MMRRERVSAPDVQSALRAAAPDVAAGMDQLRSVAESDGALPAVTKALLGAAVAAAKGYEPALHEALTRARNLGLTAAEAWGAAAVLPISRGETVAERFAAAVLELFGPPVPREAAAPFEAGEAQAYFAAYYGEIPKRIAFLDEVSPEAFAGFALLHRGALRSEGLEPRIRELLLCALNAADWQPVFLRTHALAALTVGATPAQLAEAVIATLPVAGLAVWSGAAPVLAELAGEAEPEELAERLARLEDERSILRTLYAYAHAIDYGDEAAWVDCFTEDGVFDIRARLSHQPNRIIQGRDQLHAFISSHTRAPELWHKHLLIEPVVEVDGDAATCVSYLAVVMEHEGEPLLRVFGRYRDRLARCPDGCWRFLERIAEVESMLRGLPAFVDGRPART